MRCCTLLVCRYSVAIMVDTEGSEVHTNELKEPIKAEVKAVIPNVTAPLGRHRHHVHRQAAAAGCSLCSGPRLQVGSEYTFTIRDPATLGGVAFKVSYDAFVDDVQVRTAANHANLPSTPQARVGCPCRHNR